MSLSIQDVIDPGLVGRIGTGTVLGVDIGSRACAAKRWACWGWRRAGKAAQVAPPALRLRRSCPVRRCRIVQNANTQRFEINALSVKVQLAPAAAAGFGRHVSGGRRRKGSS